MNSGWTATVERLITTLQSVGQIDMGNVSAWAMVIAAPFFVFAGIAIRQFVPLRKLSIAADEKLREDLMERVAALELKLERKERQRLRAQNRHIAERAVDRHTLGNITQCFDAVLMMFELSPEKAPEIVVHVKAMRAAQIVAEAQEKALIYAAEIAADAEEDAEDVHPEEPAPPANDTPAS